jgi:hypothetical protein
VDAAQWDELADDVLLTSGWLKTVEGTQVAAQLPSV